MLNLRKTGSFILIKRKEKGLTQAQLAERLHVSNKAVSKWENGRGFPDISLVEELCEILDVSIEELLKGDITSQPVADSMRNETTSGIDLLYKEYGRYKIGLMIKAAIVIFVVLVISAVIYKQSFSFDIQSLDSIKSKIATELLFDDESLVESIQILDLDSIGNHYYILFKTGLYKDGNGIVTLEKGIFGGFRFLSCKTSSWPLFDYEVVNEKGKPYLVVYCCNDVSEAFSYRIYEYDNNDLNGEYPVTEKGEMLVEEVVPEGPFIDFIQADLKINDVFMFTHFYYFDVNENELDRAALAMNYDLLTVEEESPIQKGPGVSKPSTILKLETRNSVLSGEGLLTYVVIYLILLVGCIFVMVTIIKIVRSKKWLLHSDKQERRRANRRIEDEKQEKHKNILKIILVSGAVALGIAANISTITYQTGLQNQMAEDKSIADVFVEDEEVYVIWDIPYINLQLKVRHKYVLQKQGEEKMVRIPGDNARYDPISHRILYSQKGSLYSCSLTMKDRKLLLQVPKANGLRLQSSGKYIVASGQTVQNVKGGESVTPIGHYWLLNLDDEEVKELSFFEEEGSYLIAANDKNLVFSYMEMASYDHTENRLIRYNLETDESQIITDQLERECVNPGYISEGFLYFVSDNRVNRIKLDGGSIESVNVPYDEFGIHKAVCIAGSEEIYIICDDSTSYTAPEHIVVVRWDAVPQIVYKESISNFLKVVHVQDEMIVFATREPDNEVDICQLR